MDQIQIEDSIRERNELQKKKDQILKNLGTASKEIRMEIEQLEQKLSQTTDPEEIKDIKKMIEKFNYQLLLIEEEPKRINQNIKDIDKHIKLVFESNINKFINDRKIEANMKILYFEIEKLIALRSTIKELVNISGL